MPYWKLSSSQNQPTGWSSQCIRPRLYFNVEPSTLPLKFELKFNICKGLTQSKAAFQIPSLFFRSCDWLFFKCCHVICSRGSTYSRILDRWRYYGTPCRTIDPVWGKPPVSCTCGGVLLPREVRTFSIIACLPRPTGVRLTCPPIPPLLMRSHFIATDKEATTLSY